MLAYENAKLCVRYEISKKCSSSREKELKKNVLYSKLAVNNFFGKLARAELVSKIILNKKRESEDI